MLANTTLGVKLLVLTNALAYCTPVQATPVNLYSPVPTTFYAFFIIFARLVYKTFLKSDLLSKRKKIFILKCFLAKEVPFVAIVT